MAKRPFVIIMLIMSLGQLISCDKKGIPANEKIVYTMPLADNIQTLSPRRVRFATDDQIMKAIFGQLIAVDNDGYLAPNICYKWEISDDLQEYTLHIRNDIKFHDGLPLTAKDIVFSFEYESANPTLLRKTFLPIAGYDEYFNGRSRVISGLTVIDDYTLKITLKKPIATYLYTLANSKVVVLPDKFHGIAEEVFFSRPIGVGPYIFEHWRDNEFVMERNENYYNKDHQIEKFVFKTMGKPQALDSFEKHEVDELNAYKVTPDEIKRKDINISKWSAYSTHFIFFNVKKRPLDNINMRLAIRAAIDRTELVNKCNPDDEVSNGVIPRGLVGAIDENNRFDNLHDSVDHYLSKAGIDRAQLPKMKILRFYEMRDECFKPTIEEMFSKAGLPIEVEYVSFEDGVKRIEANDYYMLSEWLAARNVEPISILNFFDGRSTHNLSNMNDGEINKLIDLAELSRTRSARGEFYRQISDMIIRKAYVVDLQYEYRYYVYDGAVQKFEDPGLIRFFASFSSLAFKKK